MSRFRSIQNRNFSERELRNAAQAAWAVNRPQTRNALLSLFREMTHSPKMRHSMASGTRRQLGRKTPARDSSRSGATFKEYSFLTRVSDDNVPRDSSLLSRWHRTNQKLYRRLVCKIRKERRQVLFALGKQGGNHKPAHYTIDSKVRCKKNG